MDNMLWVTSLPLAAHIPQSLQPTYLQATVPHPPWVDVFPDASVRDTLIYHLGTFDDDLLAMDVLGGLPCNEDYKKDVYGDEWDWMDPEELNGVIVWGDPWKSESWELSEKFVARWGWIFQGCFEQAISATNRWRELRHEAPLGTVFKEDYGKCRRKGQSC